MPISNSTFGVTVARRKFEKRLKERCRFEPRPMSVRLLLDSTQSTGRPAREDLSLGANLHLARELRIADAPEAHRDTTRLPPWTPACDARNAGIDLEPPRSAHPSDP